MYAATAILFIVYCIYITFRLCIFKAKNVRFKNGLSIEPFHFLIEMNNEKMIFFYLCTLLFYLDKISRLQHPTVRIAILVHVRLCQHCRLR